MKFPPGQLVATPGALQLAEEKRINLIDLLRRHLHGDWGDLGADDKAENDRAVKEGSRVFSAYQMDGERFWIITEADRSSTCILLPSEY